MTSENTANKKTAMKIDTNFCPYPLNSKQAFINRRLVARGIPHFIQGPEEYSPEELGPIIPDWPKMAP